MKRLRFAVAVLAFAASGSVFAADAACSVEIQGNDAMKFDKTSIEVPKTCQEFKVTLKHVGKLPKAAMGHNWVLTKPADMDAVAKDGIAATVSNDYIKPGDTRVIAHTKVIGGGETTDVTVPVAKLNAGETYEFFCSFPGHSALMKGTLTVK
ncbi:MAG TPA: azurin [Povalibacter sp.]|nr:azurin [Povalibacter sp.]